jgi:hypothetical protein
MENKKYFRLRSFTFSFFIFLFFLLLCKPVIAQMTETDEVQRYEVPEIVVYGEGYIPLDKDAFVYVLADTKIMRPIIDIIPVNQLKSPQASQVIDRTEIAAAALFSGDTGRFFQLVGFGSYPNLIINVALAIDRNWRYTFSDMFSEKNNYWYSDTDRLSVNLNSEEVYIVGWRRSRMNPVYEEPGVKMPEGFIAFRHRSGEPAPLSLWLDNNNSILDRMFNDEGITVNLPIERLYLNLYHVENNVFKVELMLQTRSLFFPENFAMDFSPIKSEEAESKDSEDSEESETDSALQALFFANPPVQNDHNIEFQPVFLSEEDIASLLKIFMKNWK